MSKYIVGSGGGSESKSTTATEDPTSLRSTSYAKILDILGVGEWEEVCVDGLKGFYLDDVPVQNQDGSANVKGVVLETRTGTAEQTRMTISDVTEAAYSVNIECKYNLPVERSVAGADVDKLRVTMTFPQLTEVNPSNGDTHGSTVKYQISWKNSETETWHNVRGNTYTIDWHTPEINPSYNGHTNPATEYYTGAQHYRVNVTLAAALGAPTSTGTIMKIPTVYKFQHSSDGINWTTLKSDTYYDTFDLSYDYNCALTDVVYFRVVFGDSQAQVNVAPTYVLNSVLQGIESIVEDDAQTVSGKCTSTYAHQTTFNVSGNGPYLVRITRLTADSSSSYISNKSVWEAVSVVTEEKYRYPGFALAGVSVDASQYSSIPTRSFLCKMSKIKIPSNYDPLTRIYTGIWDGTFNVAWSDNPAWVFYDIITNEHRGLGQRIPESATLAAYLYQIAQYCDELVPDGEGGYEPRFTCNVYIQTRQEAYKLISDMATVFRGITYWGVGEIVPVQDSPKTPSYAYNNSNVIDGVFNYQSSSLGTRYNAVYVTWNDPDNFYKQATEYVTDDASVAALGYINSTTTVAFGCTSRGQARRVGKQIIYTNNYETGVVQFSVGADGAIPRPGDIVRIADILRSKDRLHGRIVSATLAGSDTTFVLDADVSLVGGTEYTFSVISSDGVLIDTQYTPTEDETINTLVLPFTSGVAKDSGFSITKTGVEEVLFRILSVVEKGENIYDIAATSYNPHKYDLIEKDEPLPIVPPSTLRVAPNAIADIILTEHLYTVGSVVVDKARFSWTNPGAATKYYVYVISPDGTRYESTQAETFYELDNAPLGEYKVSVTAISAFGLYSPVFTKALTVVGEVDVPSGIVLVNHITGHDTQFDSRDAVFEWNPVRAASSYLIHIYDGATKAAEHVSSTPSYTYTIEQNILDGGPRRAFEIRVFSVNETNSSTTYASLSVSNPQIGGCSITVEDASGSAAIVTDTPTVLDYSKTKFVMSTETGFDPSLVTPFYDGPNTAIGTKKLPAGTYYFKAAHCDVYGETDLIWSPEVTVAVSPVEGYDPTTDMTVPPAPTNVTANGAIKSVLVSWDVPDAKTFKNFDHANVYRALTDSFPTGDPYGECGSNMFVDTNAVAGTSYYYWVKFVSKADVTGPYQGSAGIVGGPTLIGGKDLGEQIIEAKNIADGVITAVKFADGQTPLFYGAELPTLPDTKYPSGTLFIPTSGDNANKLFRSTGSAWSSSLDAADLPDGSVTGNLIAGSTIAAGKLIANTITAASGVIANGAILNAMIADASITNAKIADLAADKITAGTMQVGGYIASQNYSSGVTGWKISADGTAQFTAASIIGKLTASQINTTGLFVGTDFTNAVTAVAGETTSILTLTSEAVSLPANSSGVVTNYANATSTVKVMSGTTDETSLWTISTTPSTGITRTFSSGVLTITNVTSSTSSGYVTITATRSGYTTLTKQYNISKASDGSSGTNGANGTSPYVFTLSNYSAVFPADASGNVTSTTGNTTVVNVMQGTLDVTSYASISYTNVGCGVSQSGTTFTITGFSADSGYVAFTARIYDSAVGYVYMYKTYSWSKAKAGTAGINGTNGTNGATGPAGPTGAAGTRGICYITKASSYASAGSITSTDCNNALPNGRPQVGDTVNFYNNYATVPWAASKIYTAAGIWNDVAMFVNGNAVVTGTLSAGALCASIIDLHSAGGYVGLGWAAPYGGSGVSTPIYAARSMSNVSALFVGDYTASVGTNATYWLVDYATNGKYGQRVQIGIDQTTAQTGAVAYRIDGGGEAGIFFGVDAKKSNNSTTSPIAGKWTTASAWLSNMNSGSRRQLFLLQGSGSYYAAYAPSGSGKGNFVDGVGAFTGIHIVGCNYIPEQGDIMIDVELLSNHDIANNQTRVETSSKAKQKGAIGIYNDEAMFDSSWDDAEKPEYALHVNAIGDGMINVCGEGGDIEIGDYLVTSSIPGKGMKQEDDLLHNYTVARARQAMTFDNESEVKQIACIYVCG